MLFRVRSTRNKTDALHDCIAWRSHFGFSRIAIETRCHRSIFAEKSVKIVFSAGASYSENGVVLRRQCLGVRVAVADRFQSSPRKRARLRGEL